MRPTDGGARDLRILNAIAEALNASPDVQQALDSSLALVAELLDLETGWVWLHDRETGQFYNAAALNLPPFLKNPVRMTGQSCWCIDSFLDGELTPRNIHVLECSRLRPAVREGDVEATGGLAYHASIPLYSRGHPLGIMNITGPSGRELTLEELRLLSTIAYQIGVAIERARLAEEGERLARSEERARIAREIHDTLAQRFTGIALQLEGAQRHIDADPGKAGQRIERALEAARQGLDEARRSVLDLRSDPLEGKALPEALGALTRRFTSETGVRVRLRVRLDSPLPRQAESELYRIVQEALANVRRHASATEATVLLRGGRTLCLVVRDDGRGFDPESQAADAYGIEGMRERAELLGGRLRIESRLGRGTTVSLAAPREPGEPEP